MVTQTVNVVKQTVVKNKIIKSTRIAVIDVKKDDAGEASSNGVVALTLSKESRGGKDLQGCEVGSGSGDDEKENTILMVRIYSIM